MNLALPVSVSGAFFTLFPTPFSCLSIGSQRAVTASALEIVLFWLVSVCVCVNVNAHNLKLGNCLLITRAKQQQCQRRGVG